MVTGLVIWGNSVASEIILTPLPGMLKLTVSAVAGVALASRIACRSEPAPLSLMLVTVKVL
jgi:hypothetical protein